jgi:hypothetical protein
MKSFREYLAESKKVYSFKIKVAGEIPENFEDRLKERLERCKLATFSKVSTTPVQKVPLDFPNLSNMEVTVYEAVCEYPITSPEIANEVKDMGVKEECFRVRGSGEPSEIEQIESDTEKTGSVLVDSEYKDSVKVAHKDYFGNDFNKSFLKDLQTTAKQRKKELGQDKGKPDVLGTAPKMKQDKAGAKSAIGS